ncbi:hypothetical protein [Flavobacterium sp.]|uniref:hypothetical protein n=1 Tax=Flavobacterium sp. TaxID=239 RepID=UPI003528BDA7
MKKLLLLFLLSNIATFSQEKIETKKNNMLIDLSGGFSYRLGKTEDTGNYLMDNYIKNLKKGVGLDASIYVQFKKESNHYIGFKYNSFLKNSGINGVYIDAPNGSSGQGGVEDKIRISFYGLMYMYSKHINNDALSVEAGLGYIHYKDKADYLDQYIITGGSVGLNTSISYLISLGNGFYIGPKLGLQVGTLNKVTVDGPGNYYEKVDLDDESESLSKIDLGLLLRIKL